MPGSHPASLASLAAIFLACAAAAYAEPGTPFTDAPARMVRDGVFRGKIFIAADAAPEERRSAVFLAEWMRRVTGATPEIATEAAESTGDGLYVGATRRAAAAGVRPPATLSREGFAWEPRRAGRTVFLVGESPSATRLGAARFLREKLGVEFLLPGEFGADWRPLRVVDAPEAREEFAPAFAWRALSGLDTEAEKTWASDNGLGALPEMNHALWSVFDKQAFEENPAMFPLLGGRRVAPSGRGGYEPQPNLANPDSAQHAARRAYGFFQKNPGAPAFSLSINDNMTWDESPESRSALGDSKWFRNRPDYSDYVFRFMNRTAAALRREEEREKRKGESGETSLCSSIFPRSSSRFLTAYAYYHCENTPSFRVDPDVFPILTADRSEWRDPGFAAEDAALMRRWGASGVRAFGVYDYYYGRDIPVPRFFPHAQAASVRCAADCGAKLFFAELNPDWGLDGPKAWLAARLAWEPTADAVSLLDEYYKRAYGPAAPAMRRLYAIVESRWTHRTQPPRWIRFFHEESACELFPADVRARMRAALDDAENACRADAARPAQAGEADARDRRHRRVLATSEAFASVERFAEAYEAKRRLAALPDATDATGALRIADALGAALDASARHRESLERRNRSALTTGRPFSDSALWRTDPVALAAAKCAAVPGALAGTRAETAAALLSDTPGEGVVTRFEEGFEAASFRAAAPGSWAARRGLTIPRAPWRANLFEAEHTRFGFDAGRAFSGRGSLLVAGGDLARVSRRLPAQPGEAFAARVRLSGEIVPGAHVALSIRFLDERGRELRGGTDSLAPPGPDTGWRVLGAFAEAPDGAAGAEVQLRVMCQGATDSLWADDLLVRTKRRDASAKGVHL